MLNEEQYSTTLPRIIFIVISTVLVGTLLVSVMFLSSADETGLLPPWQLFAAEVVCVAILVSLSLGALKYKNDWLIFWAAVAISVVLTVAVSSVWGIGHTWSLLSMIGKTIGTFISVAYPILISAGAIVIMRRRSANLSTFWAVSVVLCLLLTVPMTLVSVVFSCATGDCL